MLFIQEQNEVREDYKIRKKQSRLKLILLSNQTRGILALLVFVLVVPVVVYYCLFNLGDIPIQGNYTCAVTKTYRIQCGNKHATLNYCNKINCCFDNATKLCFHYLPSKYYYSFDETKNNYYSSLTKSPFERDATNNIKMSAYEIDENRINIILHSEEISTNETNNAKNYRYDINRNPLTVEVYRVNGTDEEMLLTTDKGPLIVSEKYWEWSFELTGEYLFGLGQTLIELDENSTLTKVVYGNDEDHTTLPAFMAYKGGKYHSVVVKHSGPLEVTVLPCKLVSLKGLSGREVTLELNIGPSIQQIIKQQNWGTIKGSELLSLLGVHVCREGSYASLNNILDDYKAEKSLTEESTFRYESDCLHENLFLSMLMTNNDTSNVIKVISEYIMQKNIGFKIALPPHIPYNSSFFQEVLDLNVLFVNKTEVYHGSFLGITVAYPYFKHSNISEFMQRLNNKINAIFGPVAVNEFILGNNWPADTSFKMKIVNEFQYLSDNLIDAMSNTLPWNISVNDSFQFLDHNDYGFSQLEAINNTIGGSFVTASHTPDTSDPVMVQNVDISWTNFQKSIVAILSNSIFGHPLTSVPVCGSTKNFNSTHESLCMRWYSMASTAPIFRISSDLPRRDPASISINPNLSGHLANEVMNSVDFRYKLRYYFYTTLMNDEPLMRPMFYDFPDDQKTFSLVEQYMVGNGLLVAHPTLPAQSQIKIYFPKGVTWYEYWGGRTYVGQDESITFNVVETDWFGFIQEGVIIPIIEDAENCELTLKVALKHITEENYTAAGYLFIENFGYSLTSDKTKLTVTTDATQDASCILNQIQIYGFSMDAILTLSVSTGANLNSNFSCSYGLPTDESIAASSTVDCMSD